MTRFALSLVLAFGVAAGAGAQVNNYVVGPQDVLAITVFDQQDLGGKYAVEADGTFTFPLIGRVQAAGTTIRDIEAQLKTKLTKGYFKNPQVTVAIDQYRSQHVFIVGEVRNVGAYALTEPELRFEAMQTLAFGARGLLWFTYWMPRGVPAPEDGSQPR